MTSVTVAAERLSGNRNFRLLWIGETTSRFGTAVSTIVLPFVAISVLDANAFLVGLLASSVWLSWLLVGLPAGAWVDRLPARRVMLVCDFVSAALLISVPVAYWFGVLTIWQLILVALAVGVAGVFFLSAFQVFLPAAVRREHLAQANAWVQGSEAAARITGPGVGGWIALLVGAVSGVLVQTATFVASAACLLRTDVTERRPDRASPCQRTLLREIREGLDHVFRDAFLRTIAVYAAAVNLAGGALQAVIIVFAVRTVGLGAGTVGTLIAIAGIGGLIGAVVSSPLIRWLGSGRAVVVAALGTAPFALLVPLTSPGPGTALLVIGWLVPEAGVIVFNVVVDSFRQAYCPQRILGRVIASTRCLSYGAGAIGAIAGGAIAELVEPRAAVWLAVVVQVLCVAILLVGPFRARDLPVPVTRVAARESGG